MYTLKSIATRGTMLGAAFALVAAAVVPAASVFADALNPLTERSLLLSSSAPGYVDTDGSNYSTASQNPANDPPGIPTSYAPAGSGANGKKTGETFTFNVSSDSSGDNDPIKGISFQYCTSAAGNCQAPGNNDGDASDGIDDREANSEAHLQNQSDLDVVGEFEESGDATPAAGEFVVLVGGVETAGWTMDAINLEDEAHTGELTGKNNYLSLVNTAGAGAEPISGQTVQVIFKASESAFITNPGDSSFFVKINTYSADTTAEMIGSHNDSTPLDETDHTVIDGGVTVANMMTDSIHITTKVLETMDFSVGIQNKDTVAGTHGSCDPVQMINGSNRLDLGDVDAEFSLRTDRAYDAFSYWRLSSNSSGGATVYYSGTSLNNTVGDTIDEIGAEANSHPGTEQFGLALIDPSKANPNESLLVTDEEDPNVGEIAPTPNETFPGTFPSTWATPSQLALATEADYDEGDEPSISEQIDTGNNAKFAFYASSNEVPEVIAQNSDDVIRCATSKVRYVANIAADTPAGVYTTKINYLAAPQY